MLTIGVMFTDRAAGVAEMHGLDRSIQIEPIFIPAVGDFYCYKLANGGQVSFKIISRVFVVNVVDRSQVLALELDVHQASST